METIREKVEQGKYLEALGDIESGYQELSQAGQKNMNPNAIGPIKPNRKLRKKISDYQNRWFNAPHITSDVYGNSEKYSSRVAYIVSLKEQKDWEDGWKKLK